MLLDPLFLKGNGIPTVDSTRDQGIIVQNDNRWDNHIQNKLIAATRVYQFLERTVPYCVIPSMKFLYFCLCVQNNLLYGTQIWYFSIINRRKMELFKRLPVSSYWVKKILTAAGSIKNITHILKFNSLRQNFLQQGNKQHHSLKS